MVTLQRSRIGGSTEFLLDQTFTQDAKTSGERFSRYCGLW